MKLSPVSRSTPDEKTRRTGSTYLSRGQGRDASEVSSGWSPLDTSMNIGSSSQTGTRLERGRLQEPHAGGDDTRLSLVLLIIEEVLEIVKSEES
jgi:hypothetical protein